MSVVPLPKPDRPQSLADRIAALQAEVRDLGRVQVTNMRETVREAIAAASEVAANPTQPDGVRQLAEKIVRDGESLVLTLDGITARAGQ